MSFLDFLPQEIVDQIFLYVVSTPDNTVSLCPNRRIRRYRPVDEADLLGFLRTCRRVYDMYKDLLWKTNILDTEYFVEARQSRGWDEVAALPDNVTSAVQHARIYLTSGIMKPKTPEYGLELTFNHLKSCLKDLSTWKSLKNLTLVVLIDIWEDLCPVWELGLDWDPEDGSLYEQKPMYLMLLDSLYEAAENGGPLSHIGRHIVLQRNGHGRAKYGCIGFPKVKESTKPSQVLSDLGRAFQSPVSIDGRICYRDGVLLHDPFVKIPGRRNRLELVTEKEAIHLEALNLLENMAPVNSRARGLINVLVNRDRGRISFSCELVETLTTYNASESGQQALRDRSDLWESLAKQDGPRFFGLLDNLKCFGITDSDQH